jgi:hypothetical protein
MVADLIALTANNWARVSGLDRGQPPHVNGHDEFVAGWMARGMAAVNGLSARRFAEPFNTPGFIDLPARVPARNVGIVVPGSVHPDQAVIVGCHPDGEPTSHGSTYDDGSGCAIMLGVMRTLGAEWRANGLPSLTVEFVLFDAEEQGLVGSEAYVSAGENGAVQPKPAFMIDEEQSGMGYPARPFGVRGSRLLPTFAVVTPPRGVQLNGTLPFTLQENGVHLVAPKARDLAIAHARIVQARDRAFVELRPLYGHITYRGGSATTFGPSDRQKVVITASSPGGSDNQPFEAIGLPTVTLSGDASFVERRPPDFAYPFDQPEDTPTTLACFTGGSPRTGEVLDAALDLERSMSASLVNSYAPPHHGVGIALLSSVPGAGQSVAFTAIGPARMNWRFSDGGRASGDDVDHTFARPGTYTVTIGAGKVVGTWSVHVPRRTFVFHTRAVYGPPPVIRWKPRELQGVKGCH